MVAIAFAGGLFRVCCRFKDGDAARDKGTVQAGFGLDPLMSLPRSNNPKNVLRGSARESGRPPSPVAPHRSTKNSFQFGFARRKRVVVTFARLCARPPCSPWLPTVRHTIEQVRRGPIAFARRGFEVFAVEDGDAPVPVFVQTGLLQRSSDNRDCWAARAQH